MIYLVGAGPGDPGLLTVRAAALLSRADVIVYDSLVSDEIVACGNAHAERIHVGKRSKIGSPYKKGSALRTTTTRNTTQQEINNLLVSLASGKKIVVRLKGGDPFVFGRGGEEALALAQHGISFEVVPGITSAIAAPAYAGIPVTHRGLAEAVTFITGHRNENHDSFAPDYDALVRLQGTIVFLMAAGRIGDIAADLVKHGKDPMTPSAIVQWGTTSHQRSVLATLADIPMKAMNAELGSPAVFVIGAVAGLANQLDWFSSRPLFGKRIIVTSSEADGSQLASTLREEGAIVIPAPSATLNAIDPSPLDEVLRNMRNYTDLIVTSRFAVKILADRLHATKKDGRIFAGMTIAVVGEGTAASLFDATGLRADIVPERATSEGLCGAIGPVEGRRFLWPCAQSRRNVLSEHLGDALEAVPVYTSTSCDHSGMRELIEAGDADAAVFASASSARNFVALFDDKEILRTLPLIAIGPITGQELERAGLKPHYAAMATTLGLRNACVAALA